MATGKIIELAKRCDAQAKRRNRTSRSRATRRSSPAPSPMRPPTAWARRRWSGGLQPRCLTPGTAGASGNRTADWACGLSLGFTQHVVTYTGVRRRARMKPVAAMILAACLSTMALAADTGMLTLVCKGTTAGGDGSNRLPISMAVIVNFSTGTVQGFGVPGFIDFPVKITGTDDATIGFYGSGEFLGIPTSTGGTNNRVTGEVNASRSITDVKSAKTSTSTQWSLKCSPTQRKF
jgi:hypothetical protein